jgi:hypothetical protein
MALVKSLVTYRISIKYHHNLFISLLLTSSQTDNQKGMQAKTSISPAYSFPRQQEESQTLPTLNN